MLYITVVVLHKISYLFIDIVVLNYDMMVKIFQGTKFSMRDLDQVWWKTLPL